MLMFANPRRSLLVGLIVYALVTVLRVTPTTAQTCPHDGDVNQDGTVTPADAFLALQHFLGIAAPALSTCAQERANVNDSEGSGVTPADALCIFQKFLGLPSCLDIVVPPVATNNSPVVRNDTSVTDAGIPVAIAVLTNDTDPDGNTLSIAAVVPLTTTRGTATISGPNIIYTPPGGGFNGPDIFAYQACDNGTPVLCGTAQVTVTVNAVNTPPSVANSIADVGVNEDAPNTVLDLSATFSDPDVATGDRLTLSVVGNTNATLLTTTLVGTQLTLTYLKDRNGEAFITVRATDQGGGSVDDTFKVTVNPVNDNPQITQLPATRMSIVGRRISQAQQVRLREEVKIEDAENGTCAACTITVSNLPSNLQILNNTIQGIIAFNAFSRGDGGGPLYNVTVTVTDLNGATATGTFEWRVSQGGVDIVNPGESGEGDGDGDGDSADGDGGAGGDASDGGDASPLARAMCTFVDMNGIPFTDSTKQVIQTTAGEDGKFLLRIPADPKNPGFVMDWQGFVECRPPDKPDLVVSTYLNTKGIRRGERLTGLKVDPMTTVSRPLADGLRAANPVIDLVAVHARLLDDISGLQTGSPREMTSEATNDVGCTPSEPTTTVTDAIDIPLRPLPTDTSRNKARMASYIASQLFLAAFKGEAVGTPDPAEQEVSQCVAGLAEPQAPGTFITALKTYYATAEVTAEDLISLGLKEDEGIVTGPTRLDCG